MTGTIPENGEARQRRPVINDRRSRTGGSDTSARTEGRTPRSSIDTKPRSRWRVVQHRGDLESPRKYQCSAVGRLAVVQTARELQRFSQYDGTCIAGFSGWSNGGSSWTKSGEPLVFLVKTTEEFPELGALVSVQLHAQGIRTAFEVATDLEERLATGEFTAAIARHRGSISGDPYYAIAPFRSGSDAPTTALQPNFSR